MKKIYIFLVVSIFISAIILRLFKLGEIPASMTDDEVRLGYNAFSIWNTARDVNGNFLPLSFLVSNYSFNPIPIYITSIFIGIFNLSMFSVRLPFALAGIGTVFITFLISQKIFKNKYISLLSSFVLAFSAWHLQISRFAYEGQIALFLYVLAIFLFLKVDKNKFLYLFTSMFIFLLAFYSYSGTKLILLPVLMILLWYKLSVLSKKHILSILILIILSFSSFFLLSKTQNAAKYGDSLFFFQNDLTVAQKVELERRASKAPEFFKKIFHNKLTYWSSIFLDHYSYALSPQYLFLNQEGSGIFSIWFRGQMYYIDSVFLILGILFVFLKKRKEFLLLFLFLLISPLPSALGPEPFTYTIRSSFMLPWLSLFVGAGIYSISYFVGNIKIRYMIFLIISIFYIYLIACYLAQYYFEWPLYGAKYYARSSKDLIDFINKEKPVKNEIYVYGADKILFFHYAFYNKLSPSLFQKLIKDNNIQIGKIKFSNNCVYNNYYIKQNNNLYIYSPSCLNVVNIKKINSLKNIKSIEGENEWYFL